MKKTTRLAVAIAAGFALTGTTNAQAQGMGGGGMSGEGGMMMGGMTRIMAFQPRHILRHAGPIQLTDEQRESLTRIQRVAMEAHEAAKATHDAKLQEMAALFEGEVDARAAQGLFSEAHAAGGQAHWAQINAALQSMDVLNDVQKARVHGWADMMPMGNMGAHEETGGDDDDHGQDGQTRHLH